MIIHEPFLTSSIGGDTIKTNFSGSAYIGFGATSSNPTATNEFVVGYNISGSGNNTITLGNENTTETHLFGSIYRTQFVTSSITASKFRAYALSGSGYTFHLPSSPNPGDSLKISNFQTNATGSERYSTQITESNRITIGRSGEAIMGLTESLQLDYQSPTFEMIYIDSNRGWVIFGGN